MSSIFFQFYYDDGSIRPFDADVASKNSDSFEVAPVVTDVLFDLFELSPQELQELQDVGQGEASFSPPFILQYQEIAEADGEPLEGVGCEPNIYFDSATIPVESSQLRAWAHSWLQALQRMDDAQRQSVLSFNWKYADKTLKDLGKLRNQAEYALSKQVGIMLFIAW